MKNYYLILITLLCFTIFSASAQPQVWQTQILRPGVDVRTSLVVFGTVIAPIPSPGKVVVRFDGTCFADSGDRILVAAANTPNWGTNDGNVAIQVANVEQALRSFSHSRVYDVSPGTDTFYAVAQNYVNESGSGIVDIAGALTVEFFPASGSILVADSGANYNGNLRGSAAVIAQTIITSADSGLAVVHFDGTVMSDSADEILLGVDTYAGWNSGPGVSAIQAASEGLKFSPFSTTQVIPSPAGTNYYLGVAQNYIVMNGPGTGFVSSTLTSEYYPINGPVQVYTSAIGLPYTNLKDTLVTFGTLSFYAPVAGKTLVQLDGYASSYYGDRIDIQVSDTAAIDLTIPYAGMSAASDLSDFNSFSQSVLYDLSAGWHTLYALAINTGETESLGSASIQANMVVKYYGPAPTAVSNIADAPGGFNVYPNPATDNITVRFTGQAVNSTLQLLDITGQLISQRETGDQQLFNINLSSIATGVYFVRCNGEVKKIIKQ